MLFHNNIRSTLPPMADGYQVLEELGSMSHSLSPLHHPVLTKLQAEALERCTRPSID